MEAEFWHDCWERGRLGFHQASYNRHMVRFMPRLGLQPGAHVMVPLCGKSLDMLWLLDRGYAVTGIELSRKAVGDFFAENGLAYDVTDLNGIEAWRHGRLQILCSDLLESGLDGLDTVDAVYDRAALPALPANMRRDYAEMILKHLPLNTDILMQAPEYPQAEMDGPPFSVTPSEIESLFGLCCTIEHLHSEDCIDERPSWKDKGLTRLTDHVYAIRKTRNRTG